MTGLTLKPKACVVCEDIRHEISGQLTLVGVYPGDIESTEKPENLNIACYIIAEASGLGEQLFFIENRIRSLISGETTARLKGELKTGSTSAADGAPADVGFVLPPLSATIEDPSIYEVLWSIDNKDWTVIHSLKIDVPVDTAQIAEDGTRD